MTNALLLEHFDQLISTPDDVELLDRAILYLALQGKLVQQDPSDESAIELIKRIHESNHKQKSSTKDSVNEKPYDLPVGWMWTTLPEIGEVNPRNQEDDDTKESSFIPMTYIPEEYAGELKFDIRPWGEIRKGFTHLKENDVVVAKITPCFENGKAVVMKGLINGIGAGTTELHVFRGNPEFILPEYVLMFFKNYKFREDGKRKMTGSAGQQRVPKEHITLTPFPLPPYAEQQRIVARVEELFVQTRALARELAHSQIELDGLNKSALSHLLASETPEEFNQHWEFITEHFDLLFQSPEHITPLRQSILELAVRGKLTRREVGEESAKELLKQISEQKKKPIHPIKDNELQFELPDSWVWSSLDDISRLITDGTHVTPSYLYDGVPFLSVKDVSKGYLDFSSTRFISEEEHKKLSARCKPELGDVLLTKVGTTGIALVVDTDREFSIFVSIALLKIFQEEVLPDYLSLVINSPFVKRQSDKYTMGVGNKNLVLKHIKNFLIPLPPVAEQGRIVKRVEQLLSLCDALEARLQSAEEERGRLVRAVMAGVGSS
jgi:type I restriction enzyme S subunit